MNRPQPWATMRTSQRIKVRACSIMCTAHPEWGTFGVMEDHGHWFDIHGARGGRVLHKSEADQFWHVVVPHDAPVIDQMEMPDVIWRSHIFDRVEVIKDGKPIASLFRPIWCQFESGPNLFTFAHAMHQLLSPGSYGLGSMRRIGFQTIEKKYA